MKKVLIIGSGGREHALAWKVAQSPTVEKVFVAPGNAGSSHEAKVENIAIHAMEIAKLIQFAQQQDINLTIVGPEAPLAAGIVDAFRLVGLACFGPSQKAAKLESSKAYAKEFMFKNDIPTADYQCFEDLKKAQAYLGQCQYPIVIKADGLAAGKGVIICQDKQQAEQALIAMMDEKQFAQAGQKVVIETFLQGIEASFMVITDGETALPLATSQDHKARDDGDLGPNTGGMGAYSPAPFVDDNLQQEIMQQVVMPTLQGLKKAGIQYCGFLYVGLMLDKHNNFKVLEYNCRLGDPETQVILLRLQSDLVELCQAAMTGKLASYKIDWDPRFALGVVLASRNYPQDSPKGEEITGIEQAEQAEQKLFHAGTQLVDRKILTNGGRVLCACALGDTIHSAQEQAYQLAKQIQWPSVFYRHDIGNKCQ